METRTRTTPAFDTLAASPRLFVWILNLCGHRPEGNARLALGLHPTSAGNSLAIDYKSTGDSPTDHLTQDTLDITPGQWYQWAFVWDGTQARAYLNGELRLSVTPLNLRPIDTDPPDTGAIPMAIGSNRLYRALTGDADRSWYGLLDRVTINASSSNTPFADADGDENVDMDDFGVFQLCYTGTIKGVSQSCACFDRDNNGAGDDDVDASDYQEFQKCATGEDVRWTSILGAGCVP